MIDVSYLTKDYDKKIEHIKSLGADVNFLFITDCHSGLNRQSSQNSKYRNPEDFELAENAIEAMRYVAERCNIDFALCGGDAGNDYAPTPEEVHGTITEFYDKLYSLPVTVHCCVGNHDDAVGFSADIGRCIKDFAISPEKMHELCMRNNPTDENYYFFDHEKSGLRFIILNIADHPYTPDENGNYTHGWGVDFSEKQLLWLDNVALSTDKTCVILCHMPISCKGIFGCCGYPYGFREKNDFPRGDEIMSCIKKHGNVCMWLAGHVHADNLRYGDGDLHGVVTVTTDSSFLDPQMQPFPVRRFGEETETVFDVFSIKDNYLYITRFGAGLDRQAWLHNTKKVLPKSAEWLWQEEIRHSKSK